MKFEGKDKWKISVGGGTWPRWGSRGETVYDLVRGHGGASLMKVNEPLAPSLMLSRSEKLSGDDTIPEPRPAGGRIGKMPSTRTGGESWCSSAREGEGSTRTRLVLTQNGMEIPGKGTGP